MKMTSFRIPEKLHERVRIYIAKEGMTMQGFMKKAIELYLMKLSTRTHVLEGQANTPDFIAAAMYPCTCDKHPCDCNQK